MTSMVLPPKGEAELMTNWANWCQAAPGRLKIKVTLPRKAGSPVAPFDGPPNYNVVPKCINKSSDSQFIIVGGYQRTNHQSGSSPSPAPVPATYAVVTGTVVPCVGAVIPPASTWNGLVTLTRNDHVISSQRVTYALTHAHLTYTLQAASGTYVLSSTGTGGWRKVIHLGAGKKLEVTVGQPCI